MSAQGGPAVGGTTDRTYIDGDPRSLSRLRICRAELKAALVRAGIDGRLSPQTVARLLCLLGLRHV